MNPSHDIMTGKPSMHQGQSAKKPSVRQQSFYTLATQPQDNQLHSLLNAKQRLKTATGQSTSHSGYPCAIIPPTPLL